MAGGNNLNDMFELCSPDRDGYILTDSLVGKLAEQLDGNDLMTLKTVLDPKRCTLLNCRFIARGMDYLSAAILL